MAKRTTEEIYVRAVVETASMIDEEGRSPWYVGHADEAMLRTEILATLFRKFKERYKLPTGEEVNQFMLHLADKDRSDWEGYVLFRSAYEGIAALDEG